MYRVTTPNYLFEKRIMGTYRKKPTNWQQNLSSIAAEPFFYTISSIPWVALFLVLFGNLP